MNVLVDSCLNNRSDLVAINFISKKRNFNSISIVSKQANVSTYNVLSNLTILCCDNIAR